MWPEKQLTILRPDVFKICLMQSPLLSSPCLFIHLCSELVLTSRFWTLVSPEMAEEVDTDTQGSTASAHKLETSSRPELRPPARGCAYLANMLDADAKWDTAPFRTPVDAKST